MNSFSELADCHGYPYYLYEENRIAAQLALLQGNLPDFDILYSFKTNPHPAICRFMREQGVGADVASSGEVVRAAQAGFAPESVFYSAPGKTVADLRTGIGRCVITADSYTELERLEALAAEDGRILEVGLRVNPDISFGAGALPELLPGAACKFGVDEEGLASRRKFLAGLTHLRIIGLHVYMRSQVLSSETLLAYCRHVFGIAHRLDEVVGRPLSFINFGGGFGIACGEWETPLDMQSFGSSLRRLVAAEQRTRGREMRLYMESGRFLVSEAGTFVTRVEDVKESRGTTFVIAPGVMNGFMRPATMNLLGSLGVPGPMEPLYGNSKAHRIRMPEFTGERRPLIQVTVNGNLCTSMDVLAQDVILPEPRLGDIITVDFAGAYAASLSPFAFASFPRPVELYRDGRGVIHTA